MGSQEVVYNLLQMDSVIHSFIIANVSSEDKSIEPELTGPCITLLLPSSGSTSVES